MRRKCSASLKSCLKVLVEDKKTILSSIYGNGNDSSEDDRSSNYPQNQKIDIPCILTLKDRVSCSQLLAKGIPYLSKWLNVHTYYRLFKDNANILSGEFLELSKHTQIRS